MIKLSIKTTEPKLAARHAAVFLGALAVLRDGIEIALNGGKEEFIARMRDSKVLFDDRMVEHFEHVVSEVGKIVVDKEDWPILDTESHGFVMQALLSTEPLEHDVTIMRLSSGSIEAVFDDIIDRIKLSFTLLLRTSKSKMQHGKGKDMKKGLLQNVVKTSQQPMEVRYFGAGMIMIAAESLSRVYVAVGAKGIDIEELYNSVGSIS